MRAEELRVAAENLTNQASSDSLMDMADGYVRFADRMERLAASRSGKSR